MGTDNRKPLTEAQAKVFEYIRKNYKQNGLPPSYREIQKHFEYRAIGTVQDHVGALVKKGYLQKNSLNSKKTSARGVLPTGQKLEGIERIPIYGEIAAGATRETDQIELGEVAVTRAMSPRPSFALRVKGNSMIEAGIFEGDVLIIEKTAAIKNGDIVVALLEGETTVKRLSKKGNKIMLVPENKTMKPIPVETPNFSIQGKVVGLQRKI